MKRFLLTSLVAITPFAAFAQPQISCPIEWEQLTPLHPQHLGKLDDVVYGVKIRDWKPEYLDQVLQRDDQCRASKPGPQSLRVAEHNFAADRVRVFKSSFAERDRRLAQEGAAKNVRLIAAASGSPNISADEAGQLRWRYTDAGDPANGRSKSITCSGSANVLNLSAESLRDMPVFYQVCMQTRQMPPEVATNFKAALDSVAQGAPTNADYLAKVAALSNSPQHQNHKTVSELEAMPQPRTTNSEAIRNAAREVLHMRSAVDSRECPILAKQAGLPPDLVAAQYLWEVNYPARHFMFLPCLAVRGGVKFSFNSKGLGSKDSFEIKGMRTIKVTLMRTVAADGKGVLLIPVEARINGENNVITRQNLVQLNSLLQTTLQNQ